MNNDKSQRELQASWFGAKTSARRVDYRQIGGVIHNEIIDIVGEAIGHEGGEMSVAEAKKLKDTVERAAIEAFENAMSAAGLDNILRQVR